MKETLERITRKVAEKLNAPREVIAWMTEGMYGALDPVLSHKEMPDVAWEYVDRYLPFSDVYSALEEEFIEEGFTQCPYCELRYVEPEFMSCERCEDELRKRS